MFTDNQLLGMLLTDIKFLCMFLQTPGTWICCSDTKLLGVLFTGTKLLGVLFTDTKLVGMLFTDTKL